MFYVLVYVTLCPYSSFAIILMGKRELVALLNLSYWCLMMVVWLFLAVSWVCLQFVIVVFPDHTYLLILSHKLYAPLGNKGWFYILKAIKNATGTSVIFPINITFKHFAFVLTSVPNVEERFTKTCAQLLTFAKKFGEK